MLIKNIELWFRRQFNSVFLTARKPEEVEQAADLLSDITDPRILVLRQDRIGDVIVSTPILRAIRSKYSSATIDMVLSSNNISVKKAVDPFVNNVLHYDRTTIGLIKLIREIRRGSYDVVVDLLDNASTTSSLIVSNSRAPFRIGIDKENRGVYTHVVPLLDRQSVLIEARVAELLRPFGIDPKSVDLRPEYRVSSEEVKNCRRLIGYNPERRYLGVVLSGSMASKSLGVERVVGILNSFNAAELGVIPVIFGSPHENDEVLEVARLTNSIAAPVSASFHEYACLLSVMDLLWTPDTASVHLAAAWNTPCCVMFFKDVEGRRPWLPHGTHVEALVSNTQSISDIPDDDILNALKQLVDHRAKENPQVL